MSIESFIHTVYEAAVAALIGILNTHEFDQQRYSTWTTPDPAARRALANSMREFWQKTRSIPLVERWYRTMLDDAAGSARWLEAAGGIIQREGDQFNPQREPDTLPMKGGPLRLGRDPSVTTLLLPRPDSSNRSKSPGHRTTRSSQRPARWVPSWRPGIHRRHCHCSRT